MNASAGLESAEPPVPLGGAATIVGAGSIATGNHVALILLDESPVSASYDLPHLQEIHKRIFGDIYLHPFREGNGRAQRAFLGQFARDAGFTLAWQHLDPVRNVEASAAIMRGDADPMCEMLGALVRESS